MNELQWCYAILVGPKPINLAIGAFFVVVVPWVMMVCFQAILNILQLVLNLAYAPVIFVSIGVATTMNVTALLRLLWQSCPRAFRRRRQRHS